MIIGGGFAGLNAAKVLGKKSSLKVTLIDRHNYHLFQPLLYQVATAGLSAGEIAIPIRSILSRHQNVRVLMAEAQRVDVEKKEVTTDFGRLPYDYLIMGCGAQHSYFGHAEWEPYAPGLKSVEQAEEIRRRILTAFELAERETDLERVRQLLTLVVIGGGPTGVELAGTLGELTRQTLSRDFRHIDPRNARVLLIEAGAKILPMFDEKLVAQATHDLEKLGVTVRTNTRVTDIKSECVNLNGEVIKASIILWAAGVKSSRLNESLGAPLDRGGRVIVEPDLSIQGHPDVFVVGDGASFTQNGTSLPGLAPVAIQEGRFAAKAILADMTGEPRGSFQYFDKGQMATIGRRKAIAQTGKLQFSGALAWYAWLVIHIYYLVGFKNRVTVLFQWFWSYLTFKRGARLILSKEWRSFAETGEELSTSTTYTIRNQETFHPAPLGPQNATDKTDSPLPTREKPLERTPAHAQSDLEPAT